MLTEKEKYIKSIFLPAVKSPKKKYLEEEKVIEIVKQISEFGEKIGYIGNNISQDKNKAEKRKHKYDVWIAKEIKKDLLILDNFTHINLIIDWVMGAKVDIFKYNFAEAFELQKKWHQEMFEKYNIEELAIPDLDDERVVFRCKNNYFFYLLKSIDLNYEGRRMKSCVGGKRYKKKLDDLESMIISLRDNVNEPHVTMEINIEKRNGKNEGRVMQQYGKANTTPKQIYRDMIIQFVLFSTGFENMEDKEVLNFLNINYL